MSVVTEEAKQGSSADARDWFSNDGKLRVDGLDYDARQMDAAELQDLHTHLAETIAQINRRLAELEVKRQAIGELSLEDLDWRGRARFARSMKRKQIMAIHTEFARRKTLVPPLTEFFEAAVSEVGGDELRLKVLERARLLQARHQERVKHLAHRGLLVKKELRTKQHVCGDKIPYDDDGSALATIEKMEKDGCDVEDLKIYPCPWCNKLHIGNSPNRKEAKRKKRSRQAKEAREAQALALSPPM